MADPLNGREQDILRTFGHPPDDPSFDETRLARRVLELPDTGSDHWYAASAVTLAAAYLRSMHVVKWAQALNAVMAEFPDDPACWSETYEYFADACDEHANVTLKADGDGGSGQ